MEFMEPLVFNIDEINTFIEILTKNNRNSFHVFCNRNQFQKRWKQKGLKPEELSAHMRNLDPKINCYITVNGFVDIKRTSSHLRQINGFLIDLDYHTDTDLRELDRMKEQAFIIIMDLVADNTVLEPTVIVDSGRGLQLLYLYEDPICYKKKDGTRNTAAINTHKKLIQKYFDIFEVCFNSTIEDRLVIDRSVSDLVRVCRLPGTFNMHTRTMAFIRYFSNCYYRFEDFFSKGVFSSINNGNNQTEKKKSLHRGKRNKKIFYEDGTDKGILLLRKKNLEELQILRNYHCDGYKHQMCFMYFNTLIQLLDFETAKQLVFEYNDLFISNDPVREKDLLSMMESVKNSKSNDNSHHGYYKYTKESLLELLNITPDEQEALGLNKTIKSLTAKQKKEERDNEIVRLWFLYLKQTDIAEQIGVSVKTVARVLKDVYRTPLSDL